MPKQIFQYKVDHDSCWKTTGITSPLFEVTCQMADEIQKLGAPVLPLGKYAWFNYISEIKIVPGKIELERDIRGKVIKTELFSYDQINQEVK